MPIRHALGALCLVLASWPAAARAQVLSLTFDDGLDPEQFAEAPAWNAQLLAALRQAHLQAMVFPTLRNTSSPLGRQLIADWSRAGHGVGNHTARHRNLSSGQVSLADFTADVEADEQAFGGLPTWQRRLRFPYLKEGDTAGKRDGLRAWMRAHGYAPAPVSIDTSDWYYNQVYLALRQRAEPRLVERLQGQYVAHLLDRASYYDGLAVRVLHRHPPHVMLLHVNALNAATLGRVVTAFAQHGWRFVSPEGAFADPLYSHPPDLLPAGESIVWADARAAGIADLRYPGEDAEYEEPVLRAAGLLPAPAPAGP